MLLLLGTIALLIPCAILKMPEGAGNIRGKGLRFRNLKKQMRKENGRAVFPEDIDGNLEIDGLPSRNIKAKLLQGVRLPSFLQSDGKSAKQLQSEEKEKAYYVGPDMAFVTTVKERHGHYEEEMFGFVREGNQNCIWKNNKNVGARAFCSEVVGGDDVMLEPFTGKKVTRSRRKGGRKTRKRRIRRQFGEISGETKVVKDVVFCAKSFVDRFKAINDGDYDMAVEDIKEYVTCLTNEWTYGFQTVLVNAGYSLAVDTIEVIVPPNNTDFDFIRKDSRGHLLEETLGLFGQNHLVRQNTDYNNGIAHHATLLVGDPIGEETLGIAFLGTICHPYADGYRVDMTVDLDWNAALVCVHELGHSMGAGHDGLDNSCDSASYLMAAYAFSPTLVTKDTAFTFSPCTADEITNHILKYDSYGNCLADTDTEFLNDFCLGPRGRMSGSSIHDQCERLAAGYTTCGNITKVTDAQCWQYNSVWCCKNGDFRTIQHIAEGTPCLGSDPNQESFCYRGGCVQGASICRTLETTTVTTTTTSTESISTKTPAESTTTSATITTTATPTESTSTTTTPTETTTISTTTTSTATPTESTSTAPAETTTTSTTTTSTATPTESTSTTTTTPVETTTTSTTTTSTATHTESTSTTTTTPAETTTTSTTTTSTVTPTESTTTTTTTPAETTTSTTTTSTAIPTESTSTTTTTPAETTTTSTSTAIPTESTSTTTTTPAETTTTITSTATPTESTSTTTTTPAETTTTSTTTTSTATPTESTSTTTTTPAETTTTSTTATSTATTTESTSITTKTTTPAETTTTSTTATFTATPTESTTATTTTTTTPAETTFTSTTTTSTATPTKSTTTTSPTTTTTTVRATTTATATCPFRGIRARAMCRNKKFPECCTATGVDKCPFKDKLAKAMCRFRIYPECCKVTDTSVCPFTGRLRGVMCRNRKYPECC